jgi:hypothetical protein
MVKRIRLLVVLGVVAVALPFGVSAVGATGGTGTTNVTIHAHADYDAAGLAADVGLNIRCQGGSGSVIVDLDQYPPETPYPMQFHSGSQLVVCDGYTHTVSVTVGGFGIDAGRAKATATLTSEGTKITTAQRWITLVEV